MPHRKLFPRLSTILKNLSFRRNYKRISGLLGKFCDFTSIGGFRYFTIRTPFHIRLPAIIVFNISLGEFCDYVQVSGSGPGIFGFRSIFPGCFVPDQNPDFWLVTEIRNFVPNRNPGFFSGPDSGFLASEF